MAICQGTSEASLANAKGLQCSRKPNYNGIIIDAMLEIPDRASPKQEIGDASHAFIQWVLKEAGVARPLPMEET